MFDFTLLPKRRFIILYLFSFLFLVFGSYAETDKRFQGGYALSYDVSLNGLSTGKIEWQYLGRQAIENKQVFILSLDSDAHILRLLNLDSKEKVFLDVKNYLPLKVQRDVIFFGKKEIIEEFYNQEEGRVRIVKNGKETMLQQDPPINNILSLLYFFPKGVDLTLGKELSFNLPTQKVTIKVIAKKKLKTKSGIREAYLLSGRGAKRFKLWLDSQERVPLRLEFIVPVGRIVIIKK